MGKRHSREYKEYAAKLVVVEGRRKSDVSFELEVPYSTLSAWVADYKHQQDQAKNGVQHYTPSEVEKLKRQHEKEMRDLKEENEILKKAMHVFTKNQK